MFWMFQIEGGPRSKFAVAAAVLLEEHKNLRSPSNGIFENYGFMDLFQCLHLRQENTHSICGNCQELVMQQT
jgi:hypothetical protein